MKAKELANYLLENPDWDVEFYFIQLPDEINAIYERVFGIVDVADDRERKTTLLFGREDEENGE